MPEELGEEENVRRQSLGLGRRFVNNFLSFYLFPLLKTNLLLTSTSWGKWIGQSESAREEEDSEIWGSNSP